MIRIFFDLVVVICEKVRVGKMHEKMVKIDCKSRKDDGLVDDKSSEKQEASGSMIVAL